MMRILSLVMVAALGWGGMAQAQSQTLADIRQEMSVLYVDIQRLKVELSTTGAVSGGVVGGSVLNRVDALEAQLSRLIARTEALEHRVETVVADGTNRIGDLEFRLCELEPNCDISKLGETSTLGGDTAAVAPSVATEPQAVELAVGEQADFMRASQSLADGQYKLAAEQFETFIANYPGGPLTSEAHYQRGEALRQTGDTAGSARAYLQSFSGAPNGALAPQALHKLGISLANLGQKQEACVTLGEVTVRFPNVKAAETASQDMARLGCN